jgi:hypothetical protein
MNTNAEKLNQAPEANLEVAGEAARAQTERLTARYEKAGERTVESGERQEQSARLEALEAAVSVEAGGAEKKRSTDPAPTFRRGPITKKQRDESFQQTMQEVHTQLSVPERAFSKLIHNKTIETVSDSLATTVARPNAILAGAICAFLATTVIYYLAKNIGYHLSGFETIGAFVVGWIIGILFDYFKIMITGKHS